MTKKNLLMVNISGPDQPGIVASFAKVLLKYAIKIVDIEQVSLQNTLGLHLQTDSKLKMEPSPGRFRETSQMPRLKPAF